MISAVLRASCLPATRSIRTPVHVGWNALADSFGSAGDVRGIVCMGESTVHDPACGASQSSQKRADEENLPDACVVSGRSQKHREECGDESSCSSQSCSHQGDGWYGKRGDWGAGAGVGRGSQRVEARSQRTDSCACLPLQSALLGSRSLHQYPSRAALKHPRFCCGLIHRSLGR